MTNTNLFGLIKTHNDTVAGFKGFCDKLDEGNGGGFQTDKWFQLWQLVPPFAKHAEKIVELARARGINVKYNAQDGEITVYEQD
jgi:hypothetical protein